MKTALILAASLAVSMSAAHACDYMHSTSAQDTTVDPAVVASVTGDQAAPMSVPAQKIVLPDQTGVSQKPAGPTAE